MDLLRIRREIDLRLLFFVALLWLFSLPLQGSELRFAVPADESSWSSSGDKLACQMWQEIPRFGTARFTARAGGGLDLSFLLKREPAKKRRTATLRAVPPPWKHKPSSREIARTTLHTGKKLVTFSRDATLRTLYELEKGMLPVLSLRDWADARDRITVSLSPVNLTPVLQQFQSCMGSLHPDSFDDVRELNVYFPVDSHQLTEKGRATLRRIASYLEVDPSVIHVVLSGYADSSGDELYNQELAQLRVDAVQEYLLEKGVPAESLITYNKGPRKGKNRARNRRVHILLQKE